MNNIVKSGLVLFLICLVASFALGIVNDLTFEKIEAMKYDTEAFKEIMQADTYSMEEETGEALGVTHIFAGKTGENVIGYVYSVVVKGYGGDMSLAVAIDNNKTIQGYIITADSETKSLGGKAKEPEYKDQFVGKTGELKTVKQEPANDNEIQSITGATITSDAVVKGVNFAIEKFESMNQ